MGVSYWLIGTVTVIYCVLPLVSTQTCNQHIWCNDCIAADKSCAWCQDQIFRKERCSPKQDLIDKGCVDIFFPNNTMEKLKDDALQDGGMDKNPIQLQPQHINLHLRKGKSQSFNMKYRVANNVPIDMYFVLDFSTTMSTQIKLLADLTDNLVKGLQDKFSTNIYIGFGSFLDKPIQPFHITTPRNLENPCHKVPNMTCEPAYGYKHKRRLGSNIDEFIETVRNANTSVNNDPMEGGLDAIVQAAVCPDIIGWRNQSRRVMVYISDGGFHFAGDGKLAGIDKPFDGLCHMDLDAGTGEYIYSQSTRQDYPSLGHVAKILDDNDINAFFVVSEEVIYREFTKMLKQADTTSLDIKGAKNIVKEITKYYDELSSRLTMAAADIPDEVEVLIASNCGYIGPITTSDAKKMTRECKYLQRNMTIDFNVTVTLTKCPSDRSKKGGRFKILPEGIHELLEVQMDYICDCECAKNELTLWDTGGMERMSFIGQSYYRGANAALLCYSINNKETFSILSQYILDIVMNAEGAKIFLCGNFADCESQDKVNDSDIESFTRECGNVLSGSYQISCKDNAGVNEMFSDMARVLHEEARKKNMTLRKDLVIRPGETPEEESLQKRKCCTSS